MQKNHLNISRNKINKWTTVVLFIMCVTLLVFSYKGLNPVDRWYAWFRAILWCELGVLIINTVLNYFLDGIMHKVSQYKVAEPCPFLTYEQCPFDDEKKCEYERSTCLLRQRNQNKNTSKIWVYVLFVVALGVIFWAILTNPAIAKDDADWLTILQMASLPICTSVIAAILVSWIIDIPSRIKEEKSFFIDVLTSNDYLLKALDENKLTDLRLRAIKHMHKRDYPKMADGLIEVDAKVCDMLKMPYYINYSQSMYVTVAEDNPNMYVKKVKVAFTAQNPYGDKKPIRMNIGMGNNLSFENDDISETKAKELFRLKDFKISFDNNDKEWDISSCIKLGVKKSKIEGLEYNGIVAMMYQDTSNPPLTYNIIKELKSAENQSGYTHIEGMDNPTLMLEFIGKIHVKFEYEVRVPSDDNVFTKRLKYPARNFHLDYAVDDKISDISLVGQMIGTIIDQKNVIITIQPNGKQITLNTHDWLLPKNGAVVIHGRKQNNDKK